jgi:(R,R)-butanediol dehydrogenase/meso-butanediol dehydrogenase/diacetyl reductase
LSQLSANPAHGPLLSAPKGRGYQREEACVDAVRKRGSVVQIGLHAGEAPLNWFNVTYKDIDIRGSWAYTAQMWPRVMRLLASGQIPARKVVTKTVTLDTAIKEGFDALLDPAGTQLKILIDLGA